MEKKIPGKVFSFWLQLLHMNWLHEIVSIKKRILVIGSHVLTSSLKILLISKRDFSRLNCFQGNH